MKNNLFQSVFSVKDTDQVKLLQDTLTKLGYLGNATNIHTYGVFDSATQAAVQSFNADRGMAAVSVVSAETMTNLNIEMLNQRVYCIRGKITDDIGTGIKDIIVDVRWLYRSFQSSISIGRRASLSDGSYLVYINLTNIGNNDLLGADGYLNDKLPVKIICTQELKQPNKSIILESDIVLIENIETIVNFSSEKFIYSGENGSKFDNLDTIIGRELQAYEIYPEAVKSGISTDDLMRYLLSKHLANTKDIFVAKVYYAYLSQDFPSNMPTPLFSDSVWQDIYGLWNNEKNRWDKWIEEWTHWFSDGGYNLEEWQDFSGNAAPSPVVWNAWEALWNDWETRWNNWMTWKKLAFTWGGWEREWIEARWQDWVAREETWLACLEVWNHLKTNWKDATQGDWNSLWNGHNDAWSTINYELSSYWDRKLDSWWDASNMYWSNYLNTLCNQIYSGIILLDKTAHSTILESAGKRCYIDRLPDIENITDKIISERYNRAHTLPLLKGEVSLGEIMELVSGIEENTKKEIGNLFATQYDNFDRFIQTLDSPTNRDRYGSNYVKRLIQIFEISRIVRNYPDLVHILMTQVGNARELATYPKESWNNIIGYFPSDFADKATYTDHIWKNLQTLYPDIVFVSQLPSTPVINNIKTELLAHPEFNLLTDSVDRLSALVPNAKEELKRLQRIYRISPSPSVAAAITAANISSASEIFQMGRAKFETKLSGTSLNRDISQSEIETAFNLATAHYANVVTVYSILHSSFKDITLSAVGEKFSIDELNRIKNDFPNLETLFGEPGYYCECDHDNSVYSAAAYLTDLLAFLDARPADYPITPQSNNVKYYLDQRRPDLEKIHLNAHNTNTVMPYIDLVNEVLEEAVLRRTTNGAYVRGNDTCQSTLSSKELCAAPEHILTHEGSNNVKITAYDKIRESVFPMYAHLDLYHTEVRAYLEKMGIKRYELMQTFQEKMSLDVPDVLQIAAEYFDLSELEKEVIIGESFIGYDRNSAWINVTPSNPATWYVKNFLKDTNLSLLEFMDLEEISWVGIRRDGYQTPCSYSDETRFILADNNALDRTHRFIRLWRKSGWKMWELALLLNDDKINPTLTYNPIPNNTLDHSTLYNLMRFKQIQDVTRLSCEELLAFFSDINTSEIYENTKQKTCLYDRIFLNRSLSNNNNRDLIEILESIKRGGNVNISQYEKLENLRKLIAACLSVSAKDYHEIVYLFSVNLDIEEPYNIEKLSILYRYTQLAKALKISILDLITLLRLSSLSLSSEFSFDEIFQLINLVKSIKVSKLKLSEYEYLLNYGWTNNNYLLSELSETARQVVLSKVEMDEYAEKISTILEITDDDKWIAVMNYLSQVFGLFGLSSDLIEKYLEAKLPNTDVSMKTMLLNINNYDPTTPEIYRTFILLHKLAMVIKRNDISVEDAYLLYEIQDKVPFTMQNGTSLWTGFKTENSEGTVSLKDLIELSAMVNLQKTYGKTEKDDTLFSILANFDNLTGYDEKLRALRPLAGWSITYLSELGITDIDFYQSKAYVEIEKRLNLLKIVHVDIFQISAWIDRFNDKNNAETAKNALKSRYDMNTWLDELAVINKPIREAKANALATYLIVPKHSQWDSKTDLYNHFLLDTEMSSCMKTSRIVQATCSIQIFVQRCLMGLDENVVVDVNHDPDWKQWDWMKKYRLWEANRKIFIYPENWIEPELRDDKTPFFKELEDELEQDDITKEQAETVFENYLQKVHDVSNLLVCGIYREFVNRDDSIITTDSQGEVTGSSGGSLVDKLHVVARSRTMPYQFYYRNYDALNRRWSHWESIDVDIKGDMVLPIVYNRKLHLFWILTTQKAIEMERKDTSTSQDKPILLNYTEVQLGWSILKRGKWSRAQYATKKHVAEKHHPSEHFSLISHYDKEKNELKFDIRCYYHSIGLEKRSDKYPCAMFIHYGIFYFNGDVYRSSSHFETPQDEKDKKDLNKISQENLSDVLLVNGLNNDENYKTPYGFNSPYNRMFSSRMYAMQDINTKISQDISPDVHTLRNITTRTIGTNVYIPDGSDQTNWGSLLLNTTAKDSNWVLMMHNYTIWYSLFMSLCEIPFFYQDSERSFFVIPQKDKKNEKGLPLLKFQPSHHPYTGLFIKELNRIGIPGLLNRNIQTNPQNYQPQNTFNFANDYHPQNRAYISEDYLKDIVDFNLFGTYSIYNWELFFHTPLYIACKLSQNQKFEEAMRWFHYIFDPMSKEKGNSPQKYWITKPFFEISTKESREQNAKDIIEKIQDHVYQINEWLNNPYKPHVIARCRPVAYQKNVVMKYVDNLIAWADSLFRQDTMESNNEATLLYLLIYEILGKRPIAIPHGECPELNQSYNQVKDNYNNSELMWNIEQMIAYKYDKLNLSNNISDSNMIPSFTHASSIQLTNLQSISEKSANFDILSNLTPASNETTVRDYSVSRENLSFYQNNETESSTQPSMEITKSAFSTQPSMGTALQKQVAMNYSTTMPTSQGTSQESIPRFIADPFCIPQNDKLLSYWDTVEDRLFKLRHCLNIEGIYRELPLFEPPIDPAMLVKAVAAGLSIADILNDLNAPLPYYRFRVVLQKAIEFTNEVKQFGDKLLSALEKKDAEALNLLRSTQEITMQQAIKQIRKLQIDEAQQNVESINDSIKIAEQKKEYYASREFMNALESVSFAQSSAATDLTISVGIMKSIAGGLIAIPDIATGAAGMAGSPLLNTLITGGHKIAGALNYAAEVMSYKVQNLDRMSSRLSIQAGYVRRKEDWDFQAKLADMEIVQLNKQLVATEIRKMIAEKELENLEMQIEQSQSVKEYYQYKYTNEALYNWMITQISTVYFQAYKLAYDTAKKAEKCYCHELGVVSPNLIKYDYWNSLKKGLLSGDRLIQDLHKLDAAYMDKNKRTLELTKHISLAQMFPANLIELITSNTKSTILNLPEWFFDMDYPGHYKRRIKSVSVTIPNVAGPYTTVSFMLTLKEAWVRKMATGSEYGEASLNDSRFESYQGRLESICTSSAQNDSGMFELNFGDERYLPFENAGVISKWELKFPAAINQFDLSSVSDVILHINYTAENGGSTLASLAAGALQTKLSNAGAILLFSPKQDFPDAWNQMDDNNSNMKFEIMTKHLPFFLRGRNEIVTTDISVVAVTKADKNINSFILTLNNSINITLTKTVFENGDVFMYQGSIDKQNVATIGQWKIQIPNNITPDEFEDILIGFSLEEDNQGS